MSESAEEVSFSARAYARLHALDIDNGSLDDVVAALAEHERSQARLVARQRRFRARAHRLRGVAEDD